MSRQESPGREPPPFEESLSQLEEIVRTLDEEELRLEEALDLFREGVSHLRAATRLLEEAEAQVEELIEEASGELSAVDFDEGKVGEGGD